MSPSHASAPSLARRLECTGKELFSRDLGIVFTVVSVGMLPHVGTAAGFPSGGLPLIIGIPTIEAGISPTFEIVISSSITAINSAVVPGHPSSTRVYAKRLLGAGIYTYTATSAIGTGGEVARALGLFVFVVFFGGKRVSKRPLPPSKKETLSQSCFVLFVCGVALAAISPRFAVCGPLTGPSAYRTAPQGANYTTVLWASA